MVNDPCHAVLDLPKHLSRPSLGGSVMLRVAGSPLRPCSSPASSGFWRTRTEGQMGLFLQPQGEGRNAWLLLAWHGSWKKSLKTPELDRLLRRQERGPWSVVWLGPASVRGAWEDGTCRLIESTLTLDHTRALFEWAGPPETEGAWLASRLLPSRLGASLQHTPDAPCAGPALLWIRLRR